jgi:hypothetical protein
VGATPYAIVRIDGKQVGATPIVRHRIEVGTHEVVLVSPKSGATLLRKNVTIEKDKLELVILK